MRTEVLILNHLFPDCECKIVADCCREEQSCAVYCAEGRGWKKLLNCYNELKTGSTLAVCHMKIWLKLLFFAGNTCTCLLSSLSVSCDDQCVCVIQTGEPVLVNSEEDTDEDDK